MKITSVNNDIVKNISKLQQRKYRDESGLFLLEGEKAVEEANNGKTGRKVPYFSIIRTFFR